MFGLAAVVLLALALIFKLGSVDQGFLGWVTFTIAGLLALALHLVLGGQPGWPRRSQ